jgi:hypothetical protein
MVVADLVAQVVVEKEALVKTRVHKIKLLQVLAEMELLLP